MAGQSLVFSESLDDVLKVVQETPRGRWFLEAYSSRLKNEGTSTILSAIGKLENNLERMSNSGASAELLEKARNAITMARQEIAKLEPQAAKLSTEAQLFSNLAEMSRKAFATGTTESNLGKGVERALKLVADLDQTLNANSNQVAAPVEAKPAVQYFKQDEEIFEPTPAPRIAAPKSAEPQDNPNRGAKLTIRRAGTEQSVVQPVSETPIIAQLAAKIEVEVPAIVSTPVAEAATPEPSRIVIIRRKADEPTAVPLLDNDETASAA